MNNLYTLLKIIFFIFFLVWVFLHIRDRRRVLNGLAFFMSLGSLWTVLLLIGETTEANILTQIAALLMLIVLILIPILYITGFIILFTTGRTLVKREGFSISHGLSILFGLGVVVSSFILPIFINRIESKILISIMGFFIVMYSYFITGFIIYLTSSLIYNLWYERKNKDYLIVLGSGLVGDKVTPLLASRIDKAIQFYNSQKDKTNKTPKIIMSGGQGPDEEIPEALAMRNYALESGIPEEDILMESNSSSTYENLLFSSNIIKEDTNKNNPKVLFFTNNYHILRAGIIAKSLGLDYNGLGSKTKFYYYVSAIIREYIGVIYLNLKQNIVFAVIIGILTGLFYYFSYTG